MTAARRARRASRSWPRPARAPESAARPMRRRIGRHRSRQQVPMQLHLRERSATIAAYHLGWPCPLPGAGRHHLGMHRSGCAGVAVNVAPSQSILAGDAGGGADLVGAQPTSPDFFVSQRSADAEVAAEVLQRVDGLHLKPRWDLPVVRRFGAGFRRPDQSRSRMQPGFDVQRFASDVISCATIASTRRHIGLRWFRIMHIRIRMSAIVATPT